MNSFPPNAEQKIKSSKQKFGLAYGIVAGLAFAVALWGFDGYQLSQSHAYLPWIKLAAAAPLCMLIGGLAGWLTTRFERGLLGVIFWIAASGLFSWMTLIVPLVITPTLLGLINPNLRSLLDYSIYQNLPSRVGVAFMWITIGSLITAALQLPLTDQSVFSSTVFGKVAPLTACIVLMAVSGALVDELINQALRDPVFRLDQTIQFYLDNRNTGLDSKAARDMHVAALRTAEGLITPERWLLVKDYDENLEIINVLVNFNGNWVECSTVASSPSICKPFSPPY